MNQRMAKPFGIGAFCLPSAQYVPGYPDPSSCDHRSLGGKGRCHCPSDGSVMTSWRTRHRHKQLDRLRSSRAMQCCSSYISTASKALLAINGVQYLHILGQTPRRDANTHTRLLRHSSANCSALGAASDVCQSTCTESSVTCQTLSYVCASGKIYSVLGAREGAASATRQPQTAF